MLNEQKLQAIVATFAKYQVEIKTDGMRIVAINGQRASLTQPHLCRIS